MYYASQSTELPNLIYGTRAIIETIWARKAIDKVFIDKLFRSPLHKELLSLGRQQQIPYRQVPAIKLLISLHEKITYPDRALVIYLLWVQFIY